VGEPLQLPSASHRLRRPAPGLTHPRPSQQRHALLQLEIKRERITDSITKRRADGGDLGGRRPQFTDSQIRSARHLVEAGQPTAQVARDLGMSRATLYRRLKKLPRDENTGGHS